MKNNRIFKLTALAMLLALQIICMLTPIGYIPVGLLRITTMHIPVIIAGVILGKKGGLVLGTFFGLSSIFIATTQPTLTSFVFSPFVSVGEIGGNGYSILIAMIPRILLGYVSAVVYQKMRSKYNKTIAAACSAILATATNTILVLSGIYIFFGNSYATVTAIPYNTLITVLLGTVLTNGLLEMILAVLITVSISKVIKIN